MKKSKSESEVIKTLRDKFKKERKWAVYILQERANGTTDEEILDFLLKQKIPPSKLISIFEWADQNEESDEFTSLDKVINRNFRRLDWIYDQARQRGDLDKMLKTIDTLNKMAGAYVQKVEVKNNEPIQIKIKTQ